MSNTSSPSKERIYFIDNFRAWVMLCVVSLHSGMAYGFSSNFSSRVAANELFTRDLSNHLFFNGYYMYLSGLTMPTFFLLGGMWTKKLYQSLGAKPFIRLRIKRLVVPFLLGFLFIKPVIVYVRLHGASISNRISWNEFNNISIWQEVFSRSSFLWFLEYLIIFTALYVLLQPILEYVKAPRCFRHRYYTKTRRKLFSLPKFVVFGCVTTIILGLNKSIFFPTYDSFVPDIFAFLYYGMFFWFGVHIYQFKVALDSLKKKCFHYLFLSFVIYGIFIYGMYLNFQSTVDSETPLWVLTARSFFVWSTIIAYLGIFVRLVNVKIPIMRFLSDSAYWVYLVHIPIVCFLQNSLRVTTIPIFLKFLLVESITLFITLSVYHSFIKPSFFGAILGSPNQSKTFSSSEVYSKTAMLFVIGMLWTALLCLI